MSNCPSCSQSVAVDDRFCTGCGEALPPASSADEKKTPSRSDFRWKWVLLTIPIAVGTALGSAFTAGMVMGLSGTGSEAVEQADGAPPEAFTAVVILGSMVFAGLVVGLLSRGRTVLEPGVGLAAAVIAMNLLDGNAQNVVMGWLLPFALGAGGAWMGEWLQGRFASR